MNLEIERKFLVADDDWMQLELIKRIEIEQGYVGRKKSGVTIRIRCTFDGTKREAVLTMKGKKTGISCEEYEYPVIYSFGENMLNNLRPETLKKVRHVVKDQLGQVWEVDVFEGINQGLVMAEIELPSANTAVLLPDWIGREVSTDPNYANSSLVIKRPLTL